MPILLLIRHGENEFVKQSRLPGRLPGIHLNEHGQEQALALAESLKTMPIRAIYASPLERALETAQPLADALGLAIQLRPGLCAFRAGNPSWNCRNGWSGKSSSCAAPTNRRIWSQ